MQGERFGNWLTGKCGEWPRSIRRRLYSDAIGSSLPSSMLLHGTLNSTVPAAVRSCLGALTCTSH
jgi:hypothetical protein